ncbi:TonB-dependent receptor plug domain-containing protein [Saccharicrinis fermentans]|uniref:Outer membrane cobalamin translocator n=1 Tax=Saccharicrinis fermentans DSM 9555 = JCM 21142 TaxID=869213 RepID=W7Y1T6_9BACT|nr:TonB-dependent receptor plug domain-containing protein [Saccharicrinis fermentans]GAF01912.1 outer membrane cobalamin translocator [Saccharicrinis fermentans DSM 9555 = JCM 21142]
MKLTITLLLFIVSCSIINGQQVTIQGNIIDESGLPLTGATVHQKYTNNATTSNNNGYYRLTVNTTRQSSLVYSMVGCLPKEIIIEASSNSPLKYDVVLEADPATTLNETVVIAKSNIRLVEETGFNVVAIDAKPYHNSAINLTELLNQTPGVKINQVGGLGSKTNVTINGLSGNHVRFFIDGMPMDAMSSSFQINNLPVNMAERIEVYKGVVPVNFGSDALGGAVNIVTKKTPGSYLDASYSYGSFNTHLSYINAGHTSENGFTIQLNAYQNYSDNSYYVDDVSVLDFETNLYTSPQRVKRFHDTYHNETVILKTGIVNKPFADQLLLGFTLGQEYKEIQHPAYINPVYGDKVYTSNTIMRHFYIQKMTY